MSLTPEQWMIGILAALTVGITKTGLPGIGILVVPLMALVFGGRLSVGATLPLLIFGDVFAVLWYRQHARWDNLRSLLPWVIVGIVIGVGLLWYTGAQGGRVDWLNIIIGVLVLAMMAVSLARKHWGDKLIPTSQAGLVSTGVLAGFSTAVSNAAGPIMTIYLSGMMRLSKNEFMGTSAWYFFIFNLTKLPLYAFLSLVLPTNPMVNATTLLFDLVMLPVIIIGAFIGKWLLPRISESLFNNVVMILASLAALKLILDQIL
ncbi:MAG: sulfite exporter TauE/SafE family protein [Anaerolineales bacterium]|nr:sulfite exporter TauE/SafE family protein [Anaerolineales bacterium]